MTAGLTKMVSKLSREGSYRKGLEVFEALPAVGLVPDTAITNAAISALDKGETLQPLTGHCLHYAPQTACHCQMEQRLPANERVGTT